MKTQKYPKYVMRSGSMALALLALAGCKINSDALTGARDPNAYPYRYGSNGYYDGSYYGGSSTACKQSENRSKVNLEAKPVDACDMPVSYLAKVEASNDGAVRVSMTRLKSGHFPSITSMSYGRPYRYRYGDSSFYDTVTFFCADGTNSADGKTFEYVCRPQGTTNRISAVSLASTDHRLILDSVTLANPDCGSRAAYSVGFDNYCPDNDDLKPGSQTVESVQFPDLFVE
jgi:hypothetical protein